MSLKGFHVVFVALSTLLALGFGVWAIGESGRDGEMGTLIVGIGALALAVALVGYGVWFLRKLKGHSWL